MGTLSGDDYYQEADDARFYDSWEGDKQIDYDLNHRDPNWVQPSDDYYRRKHVPAKVAIMRGIQDIRAREAAEAQAKALGGRLSADGTTILIPVMTETQKVEAKDRYSINKAARVGATIECACCGKSLVKKHYQQAFCPPVNKRHGKRYVCKDRYWNATVPERAARANAILGVG